MQTTVFTRCSRKDCLVMTMTGFSTQSTYYKDVKETLSAVIRLSSVSASDLPVISFLSHSFTSISHSEQKVLLMKLVIGLT
ncbi:hypothetical protein KIN20_024807 [Parelaphostrongylus tenuis]|uniref:Uncharacterized protein n=1 Tax=Parelaphostrongylus tenuis TaxID=148309 RepID=A0AAD5N7Z7_PARTN|nr:hypothetical protein KIN20_024807 [Parelaphostrongylus tenuis]